MEQKFNKKMIREELLALEAIYFESYRVMPKNSMSILD